MKRNFEQVSEDELKRRSRQRRLAITSGIVVLGAGASAGIKYIYDEQTNTVSYAIDPQTTVMVNEQDAGSLDVRSLIKDQGQAVTIQGELDTKNYEKQTIRFSYQHGWSTKEGSLDIQIIQTSILPEITLNNDIINVQKGNEDFKIQDVIGSIKDQDGKTIELKEKEGKGSAYIDGSFDVKKTGSYPIRLKVQDEQGNASTAYFVINVVEDKEEADKDIKETRTAAYQEDGAIYQMMKEDAKEENRVFFQAENPSNITIKDEILAQKKEEEKEAQSEKTAEKQSESSSQQSSSSAGSVSGGSGSSNNAVSTPSTNSGNSGNSGSSTGGSSGGAGGSSSGGSGGTSACTPFPDEVIDNQTVFGSRSAAMSAGEAWRNSSPGNGYGILESTNSCGQPIWVLDLYTAQ